MRHTATPSSVMYDTLKKLKISNKEAASLLLSDAQKYGDMLLRDRINERTFLHRLTKGEIAELTPSSFSDFPSTAQTLCARIVNNDSPVRSMGQLSEMLLADPLRNMANACRSESLDGALLENVGIKIAEHPSLSDADRASAAMIALITSGCLDDPAQAAKSVGDFLRASASQGFRTQAADDSRYQEKTKTSDVRLGLARVIDGGLDFDRMHTLSATSKGTVIGSMATDEDAVNDVGPLVSKRHLRIYRDDSGNWFAVGLGSTNGTKLISGSDKREIVVEPTKEERNQPASPVPILPGDALCLAGTTVFLVMRLAS